MIRNKRLMKDEEKLKEARLQVTDEITGPEIKIQGCAGIVGGVV